MQVQNCGTYSFNITKKTKAWGVQTGAPCFWKSKGMVSNGGCQPHYVSGEAAGVGVARLPMPCLLLA